MLVSRYIHKHSSVFGCLVCANLEFSVADTRNYGCIVSESSDSPRSMSISLKKTAKKSVGTHKAKRSSKTKQKFDPTKYKATKKEGAGENLRDSIRFACRAVNRVLDCVLSVHRAQSIGVRFLGFCRVGRPAQIVQPGNSVGPCEGQDNGIPAGEV